MKKTKTIKSKSYFHVKGKKIRNKMNKTKLLSILAALLLIPSVLASYTANYTAEDFADISVDVFGHFGVAIISLAGFIVLAWVVIWIIKKIKGY